MGIEAGDILLPSAASLVSPLLCVPESSGHRLIIVLVLGLNIAVALQAII